MKQNDNKPDRQKEGNSCLSWLQKRKATAKLGTRQISFKNIRFWRMRNGRIEHETGKFFSIVGIRGTFAGLSSAIAEQPIILQPEIGILGILVRKKPDESQILIQAKAEPGNVDKVQLSPTVQATVSNYTRVHGGLPTPYIEFFTNGSSASVQADSLQSEQGTRFLGKYNRNMTILLNGDDPEPASNSWRWCHAGDVLRALKRDYSVNTDLRSVLACSDWSLFSPDGTPFSGWKNRGGIGEGLLDSYLTRVQEVPTAQIFARLKNLRDSTHYHVTMKSIRKLNGWTLNENRLVDETGKKFEVNFYRVKALDREVTDWDQPLINDLRQGSVVLVCQRRKGVLHFLLCARLEPGFREKIQFGPSYQEPHARTSVTDSRHYNSLERIILSNAHEEHLNCLLSEEGGRFYKSTSRYRIIEFREEVNFPEHADYCWVTLHQINELIQVPGTLTNEARSAASLLLSWLPGP